MIMFPPWAAPQVLSILGVDDLANDSKCPEITKASGLRTNMQGCGAQFSRCSGGVSHLCWRSHVRTFALKCRTHSELYIFTDFQKMRVPKIPGTFVLPKKKQRLQQLGALIKVIQNIKNICQLTKSDIGQGYQPWVC